MAENTLQGWSLRTSISTSIEYEALGSSFYEVQVPAAAGEATAIEAAAAADGEGAADGMMVEGAEGAN